MYEEALEYAELLYNSSPSIDNIESFAHVLFLLGQKESVFYLIESHLTSITMNEALVILFGLSSLRINPEQAIKTIAIYLKTNPHSDYVLIVLAKLKRLVGDSIACRKNYEKAVELNPMLINAFKEATILGGNTKELLFSHYDSDSEDSSVYDDPGIVTRAHSANLQSNLSLTQSNLRHSTKSLKRKSSHDSSNTKKRKVTTHKTIDNKKEIRSVVDETYRTSIHAFSLVIQNKYEEAYKIISTADILNKNCSFASIIRIQCQHELNFPISKVLFSISQHLQNFPYSLLGLHHIIFIVWIYQDVDRLCHLAKHLNKVFPKSWQYFLTKGCAEQLQQEFDPIMFTTACSIDISNVSYLIAGWVNLNEDNVDVALNYFNEAKRRHHCDPRVLTGLGYVYIKQNNLTSAHSCLVASERLKPNSETNKKLMVEVLRKMEKYTESYDCLSSALLQYPNDNGLLNEKIILCIKMNLFQVFIIYIGSYDCSK